MLGCSRDTLFYKKSNSYQSVRSLLARHRGPDFEKNMIKRNRKATAGSRPPPPLHCFACEVDFREGDHQISVGIRILCDFCDDLLTKRGYLQINNDWRLYRDGTTRKFHYQIRDIVTGRIE